MCKREEYEKEIESIELLENTQNIPIWFVSVAQS